MVVHAVATTVKTLYTWTTVRSKLYLLSTNEEWELLYTHGGGGGGPRIWCFFWGGGEREEKSYINQSLQTGRQTVLVTCIDVSMHVNLDSMLNGTLVFSFETGEHDSIMWGNRNDWINKHQSWCRFTRTCPDSTLYIMCSWLNSQLKFQIIDNGKWQTQNI